MNNPCADPENIIERMVIKLEEKDKALDIQHTEDLQVISINNRPVSGLMLTSPEMALLSFEGYAILLPVGSEKAINSAVEVVQAMTWSVFQKQTTERLKAPTEEFKASVFQSIKLLVEMEGIATNERPNNVLVLSKRDLQVRLQARIVPAQGNMVVVEFYKDKDYLRCVEFAMWGKGYDNMCSMIREYFRTGEIVYV